MKFTYPKPDNYDLELDLYVNVLKLKSLHWGYWLPGEKLTKENLDRAQARYSQKIISLIPAGVKTILDVGAGIGDNAQRLSRAGFRVTALSPEPVQRRIFADICKQNKRISFIFSKYEDLDTSKKFDLILMSESSNYFPLKKGADRSQSLLNPGGFVLVSGLFRKKPTREYSEWHVAEEFVREYRNHGFKVLKQIDISHQAAPTMELASAFYTRHFLPFADLAGKYYRRAFQVKTKLIGLFFKKEISLINTLITKVMPERLDVKKFKTYGKYEMYLFQLKFS